MSPQLCSSPYLSYAGLFSAYRVERPVGKTTELLGIPTILVSRMGEDKIICAHERSFKMGMFGMFGSKKEGGVDTGEYGSDQVGMMKMLAGMPHMMRKPMMKGRLSHLLSLSEEKRQESIRDMIGAFHSPEVKDKAREKLIATRVEIISELPEEKRRTIMSSRSEALKSTQDLGSRAHYGGALKPLAIVV